VKRIIIGLSFVCLAVIVLWWRESHLHGQTERQLDDLQVQMHGYCHGDRAQLDRTIQSAEGRHAAARWIYARALFCLRGNDTAQARAAMLLQTSQETSDEAMARSALIELVALGDEFSSERP